MRNLEKWHPISIRLMEQIGADTYNVPIDLTLDRLAAIRQVVDIPIDIYVETPDDIGGYIRHYEIPEIIRVAAAVFIKFALRNSQIYILQVPIWKGLNEIMP